MNLQRGMRDKIANYINADAEFCIEMGIIGSAVYDFSCFGIDQSGRLSDDRYMIFYNQTASPAGEITLTLDNNTANLGSASAKVVVVLDYSGSMSRLYANGTVQHTIDRLVPLGLTFDDNGSIDVYLFQSDYRKMTDLSLSNYDNYVRTVIAASGYTMGGTNYAPVLSAIIGGGISYQGGFLGFGRKAVKTEAIVDDADPTFILFITDGENADRNETDRIILKSSEMNVFIQFIGIGDYQFRYLEKLDDMPGRKRDNTGFSKMKDLERADDNELYMNVLRQFSCWLRGQQ
ncbi:MAG: VWA domain-containing protein [Lachnospiraceae bacterium]|nr:VWA domain-containing protein [Lachnospiraceae bacterium]